jgi:hypothetical protein
MFREGDIDGAAEESTTTASGIADPAAVQAGNPRKSTKDPSANDRKSELATVAGLATEYGVDNATGGPETVTQTPFDSNALVMEYAVNRIYSVKVTRVTPLFEFSVESCTVSLKSYLASLEALSVVVVVSPARKQPLHTGWSELFLVSSKGQPS